MQVEAISECPDVTLGQQQQQPQKNKTNGLSSVAVRSKTNGEPSARIYTSTPKSSYPKLQQYAGVAEPTAKGRVGVVALAFDPRLKTAALLFGLLIIACKSVILTSKCAKLRAKYRILFIYILTPPFVGVDTTFKAAIVGGDAYSSVVCLYLAFINSLRACDLIAVCLFRSLCFSTILPPSASTANPKPPLQCQTAK